VVSNAPITPGRLSRIEANWQAIRSRARTAERHLTAELDQHDGYPTNAPMNGSEGIGRASGPTTSTVERAALGAHAHLDNRRAAIRRDVELLDIVSARLLAAINAALPPVAPPATCNGGLGREGADEWASDTPCAKIATRGGLCDMHRMRERRYRADNGLEAREEQ
jgi:hypothetical protein